MTKWNDFSETHWKKIEVDWKKWWNGELERPLISIEAVPEDTGVTLSSLYPQLGKYGFDNNIQAILDEIEKDLLKVDYLGDAFPRWCPNFGPGSMAAVLGSELEYVNNTTWFHPLKNTNLEEIKTAIDKNSHWWQRHQEFFEQTADRWQDQLVIGNTDIGGNLDILASLRGSNLLLTDLIDQPDVVQTLLNGITDAWIEMFLSIEKLLSQNKLGRSYWAPIWAPGSMAMLQCDFSTMISPKMFDKFVMPDLLRCCNQIDFPFYHLDGRGAIRHLESLLSIEKLKGIQWIPGAGEPPAEEWIPLLKRIRDAGKLCQVFLSPQGALKICQEIGGKGFLFCIGDARLPTPDEGMLCLEEIEKLISK